MAALGIPTALLPFPGAGHVPWDNNQHMMNEVDSALAIFFYSLTCPLANGVLDITKPQTKVNIYPNPSTGQLHIALEDENELSIIVLTDITGRQILKQTVGGKQIDVYLPQLASGIYTLQMQLKAPGAGPVTRKIIIE